MNLPDRGFHLSVLSVGLGFRSYSALRGVASGDTWGDGSRVVRISSSLFEMSYCETVSVCVVFTQTK